MSSDEEMEREWQAGRTGRQQRPQSTVARAFSASLDELFKIENSVADLDAVVSAKKYSVTSQATELEALEARLRAAENRLKSAGINSPTFSSDNPTSSSFLNSIAASSSFTSSSRGGSRSPRERPSISEETFQSPTEERKSPTSPLAQNMTFRPKSSGKGKAVEVQHAQVPPMPGRLPPTPGTSEGESEEEEEEDSEEEYSSEEDGSTFAKAADGEIGISNYSDKDRIYRYMMNTGRLDTTIIPYTKRNITLAEP